MICCEEEKQKANRTDRLTFKRGHWGFKELRIEKVWNSHCEEQKVWGTRKGLPGSTEVNHKGAEDVLEQQDIALFFSIFSQ